MIPESPEPVRKRQRLSSPTYDQTFGDLSQDELVAFDDVVLSRKPSLEAETVATAVKRDKEQRIKAIADALKEQWGARDEDLCADVDQPASERISGLSSGGDIFSCHHSNSDNPFNVPPVQDALPMFVPASFAAHAGNAELPIATLSGLQPRSPSPEHAQEIDYSSWYQSNQNSSINLGFSSAMFAAASTLPALANDAVPLLGFVKASHKGSLAPSARALEKAAEKLKVWQADIPTSDMALESETRPIPAVLDSPLARPSFRPVLRTLENSYSDGQPPESPTPVGNSFRNARNENVGLSVPTFDLKGKQKAKPFKSPLLNAPVSSTLQSPAKSSLLNPNRNMTRGSTSAATYHPPTPTLRTSVPPATRNPVNAASALGSNPRPLGLMPRSRAVKKSFKTPFKSGMAPGEPGRAALENAVKPKVVQPSLIPERRTDASSLARVEEISSAGVERKAFFNLTNPSSRQTLQSCGLVPQAYTASELESIGINIAELDQITPTTALYYSFHTPSANPLNATSSQLPVGDNLLGATAALEELLARGCSLVTKPWVDNHWALILWKLAGMVALDPQSEQYPVKRRWCWAEVIRQLLYRYERELNGVSRPSLRLITTHDAPAYCPMTLCVSNITWTDSSSEDGNSLSAQIPELEVTDGWYRLRAQVDEALAKAVSKGLIRIGRKIAVAGARLLSERKDAEEILDCDNSTKLVLSGNSCHLAPWHAKLGFHPHPFVATLHSLTADGGVIALMDVVVQRTFPIAFLEFVEDENQRRRSVGPRGEKEELKVAEQWKQRREKELYKLRSQHEKRWDKYTKYAERLEHKAGSGFRPSEDDSPSQRVEAMYDDMENTTDVGTMFASLTPTEAGWLARIIRDNMEKEQERAAGEIEDELKDVCPPREVRNFRVMVVKDAATHRRPANRVAQLTVWDVLGLSLEEGDDSSGEFRVGQRFLVTNLIPTQHKAWMDCDVDSQIFLSTRRDSRWTRIPS